MTLWKQKQDVLNKAVTQTEDNLKKLRDEQGRLDADGVDKNSDKYRELEREIIRCENKLKDYNKEARSIPSAEIRAMGEAFKETGAKITEAGKNMTKYVTAPIVAGAGLAVKAFDEVDGGIDAIIKKTGASGGNLDGMTESMKNLATSIPTDFETAGNAIGEVNTRFGTTGKDLEDLSGQFIKFAQLNDTDVVSAIDGTQKALSAYGLGAESAGDFLDRMNQVAQQTGVSVDTLQGGVVQNATAFQEMGLSIDQATVFMGQMEKSGADSSAVMGGLRKALKNATAQGIPLDQALSDLQNTIQNGEGDVDGLTKAYELFGKSGDQVFNAVKNGSLDFEALAGAVEGAGGSVSDTFAETQDPADEFQKTMNNLKVAGMEIASVVMPMLSEALQKLSEFITGLREKWDGLDEGQQKAILAFAGILAVVGPLLMAIGSIVTMVGNLLIFGPMIMATLSGMIAPILAVIAVIAGLVTAGVLLYKNWDTIKQKAGELLANISAKFQEIKASVTEKTQAMISAVKEKWESLKQRAGETFESIKKKITEPIESAKEKVKSVVDFIKGLFPISIGNIFKNLKTPHFSLKWGERDFGKLGTVKYPTGLGVDWYAKGGIFTRPTIFNTPGGFAGVGEAGAEAVLPLDLLWQNMRLMADSIVNGVVAGVRMQGNGGNITIPVYLYPGGQKMDEIIVRSYDRGKERLG